MNPLDLPAPTDRLTFWRIKRFSDLTWRWCPVLSFARLFAWQIDFSPPCPAFVRMWPELKARVHARTPYAPGFQLG